MQNIILFYGENTFLIREKAMSWEQEFVKKHGDLNLIKLEGSKTSARELFEQANQVPFLSEKKLIIVNGFLQKKADSQKEFLDFIEKIADFTVILFVETTAPDKRLSFFKHLKKNCRAEEFKNYEGMALTEWIIKETQKRGSQIGQREATYLTEIVGIQMGELHNEIEKLSLYKKGAQIAKEDIDKLVTPKLSYNIFKLTDALSMKNPKQALKILEHMKKFHEEMPMIFHMIVRQFRILTQIKDCLNKGMDFNGIKSHMKDHPFVIKSGMKQAKNYTMDELKEIHQALLKIERGFKTGKIQITTHNQSELERALQVFVVEHC